MGFPEKEVINLLVDCHRRCCICHRFCGFKMETDHMIPSSEGGSDEIDNAIPVCFECHAEIHLYNDKHPRGRKYRPEELRRHKDQWLKLCKSSAAFLASVPLRTDVGPLQALIDELEFNEVVASQNDHEELGALFEVAQFNRCVSEGVLSLIEPSIKQAIFQAYVSLNRANNLLTGMNNSSPTAAMWTEWRGAARKAVVEAKPGIEAALEQLRKHLAHDSDSEID